MQDDFTLMINKFRELIPSIKIRKEPQESLENILKYEKEYNMNTRDALELYKLLDEEVHLSDKYQYLRDWINEYHTYQIFKGDMNKINCYE